MPQSALHTRCFNINKRLVVEICYDLEASFFFPLTAEHLITGGKPSTCLFSAHGVLPGYQQKMAGGISDVEIVSTPWNENLHVRCSCSNHLTYKFSAHEVTEIWILDMKMPIFTVCLHEFSANFREAPVTSFERCRLPANVENSQLQQPEPLKANRAPALLEKTARKNTRLGRNGCRKSKKIWNPDKPKMKKKVKKGEKRWKKVK